MNDTPLKRGSACGTDMMRERLRYLYARHHGFVWQTCWRYVQNSTDTDDLAQDVLVKAACGWANFRGDCAETTWLFRVAVNHCRTQFRSRRDHRRSLVHMGLRRTEWPFVAPVADGLQNEEQPGAIATRVLNTLREARDGATRQIVHLTFDRGMPQRGIARVTGLPRATVRRRLARIHERALDLYQAYRGRGPD